MLPLIVLAAQTPAPLAEATRAVETARDAFRAEAKPTSEQVVKLRFALEKAVKVRSGALGRFHPGTLEAAGLWGVALHRTGEGDRGDRVWARACTELTRGLKLQERFHGAASKQLLPHLEALESCFEAQGLNARPYADRLLDIAVATSKGPRPDLERRAVAALRKAYGEFLVMRGPDTEGVLHWAESLADLWLRRPEGAEASQAFIQTALRSDARGVWKLCAREGGEALQGKVARLLARVDPAQLARERRWAGTWAHPLLQTAWKGEAQAVLARVDRHLAGQPGLEALLDRVDLAEAEGAWARGSALLREALETAPPLAFGIAFTRALDFLERRRDPDLLEALARALAGRAGTLDTGQEGLERGLAAALEAEGRWAAAEGLRRRSLRPGDPEALRDLARNLDGQGRFEEAATLFTRAAALGDDADLGFEAASAWRRAGQAELGDKLGKEALQAWARSNRARPRRGFAQALSRVAGQAAEADLWAALAPRLRKELGLSEGIPLPPPELLVQALADEEDGRGGGPCDGGDPARPAEIRARTLLARVALRDTDDEEGCLDRALKLLGEVWEPLDPRWIPWLREAADRLKDRAPAKAEGHLRRAVEVAAGTRAPEGLELRTLLGVHLLQQGRLEEGRGVLLEAFDRAAPTFRGTEAELDVAGGLVLALLQGCEEDLRYDEALALVRRCQAVLDRVEGRGADAEARRDLDRLQKALEHQATLQGLMGSAWPK